jgi:hypothetical protein
VATLVRLGHVNAWDYPMDLYRAAIDELKEANRGDGV